MAGYDLSMHWQELVLVPFGELVKAEQHLAEAPDEFHAMRAGIAAAFFLYHFHEVAWARDALSGLNLSDVRSIIEQAGRTDNHQGRVEDHELIGDVVNAVKHGYLGRTKLLLKGDNKVLLISPGQVMTYDDETRNGQRMVIVRSEGGDRSLAAACRNVINGWHDTLGLPV